MPTKTVFVDGMVTKSYVSDESLVEKTWGPAARLAAAAKKKAGGLSKTVDNIKKNTDWKGVREDLGKDLGGMAGATGGALAGAAAGSVVPGVGNVLGAGIGMGAGFLAGRAAGKHIGSEAPKEVKNPKTIGQKFNAADQKVHAWSAKQRQRILGKSEYEDYEE